MDKKKAVYSSLLIIFILATSISTFFIWDYVNVNEIEDVNKIEDVSEIEDDNEIENSTVTFIYRENECMKVANLERCWSLLIPSLNSSTNSTLPLVIDMHGYTNTGMHQKALSGFDSLSSNESFAVLWPYGVGNSWNAGRCCGTASSEEIDDVGFIRELVTNISSQYSINSKRIYATGYSNGCAMAHRLANEASDLISAVACMSFYSLLAESSTYQPISLMEIHGTEDGVVGYDAGLFIGAKLNFNQWAKMNNCSGSAIETWRDGESFTLTYKNCDGGTEVSLVTIDGGMHNVYPKGGTIYDTTQMAWDFMSRFTK